MKEIKVLQKDFKKYNIFENDLNSVEILVIWECKKIDYSFIKHCKNLKRIRLSDYPFEDMEWFNNAPTLETIEIIGIDHDISLKGIESLKNLKTLDIETPVHWDYTKSKTVKILDIDSLKALALEKLTLVGFNVDGYNKESFAQSFNFPYLRIGGNIGLVKKDN